MITARMKTSTLKYKRNINKFMLQWPAKNIKKDFYSLK